MTARLTRREILGRLGVALFGVTVPRVVTGCGQDLVHASRADSGLETGDALPGDAHSDVSGGDLGLEGLPNERGLWRLVTQMNELGPRFTGNRAHAQYVDLLAEGLESLGLTVKRDTKTFPRWSANHVGLLVPSTSEQMQVTSYYPYSGETPPDGVTAQLVYAGMASKPDYGRAKGKIVVLDCPISAVSLDDAFHVAATYPTSETFPKTAMDPTTQLLSAPSLKDALAAGAVGALLVWTNVSDEAARDQYVPFGRPHQGLPALWVGNSAGDRLKKLADSETEVTLTLTADSDPNATTDSIWAVLPGQTDEVIIVNSHTDGPNAVDENGGVAVLAIATALTQLPVSRRRRTVVFALTTGHLAAGPGSIVSWVRDHADIVQQAVAAVTIEHCGSMEWADDDSGAYRATGKAELGLTMTPMRPEVAIFEDAMQGTDNQRMFAIDSTSVYFGEGKPLFVAGIPTISYAPLPSYLFSAASNGHMDKLSSSRLAQEVLGFARAVRLIDAIPASALKG